MRDMQYTLLMTVYSGTKVEEFKQSLDSMLLQTIPPNEIVIVADGPVSENLASYIYEQKREDARILYYPKDVNEGPGAAAQYGLGKCSYEYVARLDSDDIAHPTRIEKQLSCFKNDESLSSVGTLVSEYVESPSFPLCIVELPEDSQEIARYARRRCPCRQTTLLYKRSAINKVGGYRKLRIAEEWDLYNRLIAAGYRCFNIQEVLVAMRVGEEYFARRGGYSYFKAIVHFKVEMFKEGRMTLLDLVASVIPSMIVSMLPNGVRSRIYTRLLRSPDSRGRES